MKQTIAVIGSRDGFTQQEINRYMEHFDKSEIKQIITGGARGVDKFVEFWAGSCDIQVKVIRPENPEKKYDYLKRNTTIVDLADKVVVFWDGRSKGTKFTIDYAKSKNKLADVIKL